MDISTDYLGRTTQINYEGEFPHEAVAKYLIQWYTLVSHVRPSEYKGFTNVGVIILKWPDSVCPVPN
jgi:hypothetical protein